MSVAALSTRLSGKRAFITGGGSGLGFEMARVLARDAWTVGLFEIDSTRLAQATEALQTQGARVLPFVGDVTDFAAVDAAVATFASQCGGLDLMINNAGVACAGGLLESPLADWNWIIQINLLGVVHGCRAAAVHLERSPQSILLNISSAGAFAASPLWSPYAATKAAVVALSETLVNELGPQGVQVSVAMPGFVKSDLLGAARAPERIRKVVGKVVQESRYSIERCAADILAAAGRGDLYIVVPGAVRIMWRIKRWLPTTFIRNLPKLLARF